MSGASEVLLVGRTSALVPCLSILLRRTASHLCRDPRSTAFLCNRAIIRDNRRISLSNIPTKSSFRISSKAYARFRAARFPFAVGLITENLRSRGLMSRMIKRLNSRRSINRVIIPLSLPSPTASCPGVIILASTQRRRTLASWTVIPNLRKRRSSDVCSLMEV